MRKRISIVLGSTPKKADVLEQVKVIVEGFVDFDYEITQLTVRHIGGTSYLEPVGHVQVDGDYRGLGQPPSHEPYR